MPSGFASKRQSDIVSSPQVRSNLPQLQRVGSVVEGRWGSQHQRHGDGLKGVFTRKHGPFDVWWDLIIPNETDVHGSHAATAAAKKRE